MNVATFLGLPVSSPLTSSTFHFVVSILFVRAGLRFWKTLLVPGSRPANSVRGHRGMSKWDLAAIWARVSPDEIRFECHFSISSPGPKQIKEITRNRKHKFTEKMMEGRERRGGEGWAARLSLKDHRISGDVAVTERWNPATFLIHLLLNTQNSISHIGQQLMNRLILKKYVTEISNVFTDQSVLPSAASPSQLNFSTRPAP